MRFIGETDFEPGMWVSIHRKIVEVVHLLTWILLIFRLESNLILQLERMMVVLTEECTLPVLQSMVPSLTQRSFFSWKRYLSKHINNALLSGMFPEIILINTHLDLIFLYLVYITSDLIYPSNSYYVDTGEI